MYYFRLGPFQLEDTRGTKYKQKTLNCYRHKTGSPDGLIIDGYSGHVSSWYYSNYREHSTERDLIAQDPGSFCKVKEWEF